MEEFGIEITDGCNKDIDKIADYISNVFLDESLANKVVLELYSEIKKLSYLAVSFDYCENEQLKGKGIRRYKIKRYYIYYYVNNVNRTVNVLRVRHFLQDEKKFFGNYY